MDYFKPFEKTEDSLDQKIVFYLPSKRKDNTELGILLRAQATHAVMNFLLKNLGGATMMEGRGYFKDDCGVVHSEQTTLCTSYFSSKKLTQKLKEEINHVANSLAVEFNQDTIAVSLNGTLGFFSPTPNYKNEYNKKFKKLWESGKMDPIGFRKYCNLD